MTFENNTQKLREVGRQNFKTITDTALAAVPNIDDSSEEWKIEVKDRCVAVDLV